MQFFILPFSAFNMENVSSKRSDEDDSDQVSCLARGSDGRNLTVTQLAEKDQVIIIIIIITLQPELQKRADCTLSK